MEQKILLWNFILFHHPYTHFNDILLHFMSVYAYAYVFCCMYLYKLKAGVNIFLFIFHNSNKISKSSFIFDPFFYFIMPTYSASYPYIRNSNTQVKRAYYSNNPPKNFKLFAKKMIPKQHLLRFV